MNTKDTSCDVFLSYASQAEGAAQVVRGSFEERGLRVFSESHIGSAPDWEDAVRTAMAESLAFIAIVSRASSNSAWIYLELGGAMAWSIPVYLLLDGIEERDLPSSLAKYRSLPISQHQTNADEVERTNLPMTGEDVALLGELYTSHRIPTDQLASHPIKLEQISAAFNRRAGRQDSPESPSAIVPPAKVRSTTQIKPKAGVTAHQKARNDPLEAFTIHQGKAALLDWSDVNTDLIIPARYLKRVERTGYGPLLFADKRYEPGGSPSPDDPNHHGSLAPDFPLNTPAADGATILVVGKNFGCGSSREHAVWAVAQAGFRAVIAPGKNEGFADIFEGNSYNNGLLPIELADGDWSKLADTVRAGGEVTIDLQAKTVSTGGSSFAFDVPEENRQRMLKGLDFIAETMLEDAAIRKYEASAPIWAGVIS